MYILEKKIFDYIINNTYIPFYNTIFMLSMSCDGLRVVCGRIRRNLYFLYMLLTISFLQYKIGVCFHIPNRKIKISTYQKMVLNFYNNNFKKCSLKSYMLFLRFHSPSPYTEICIYPINMCDDYFFFQVSECFYFLFLFFFFNASNIGVG